MKPIAIAALVFAHAAQAAAPAVCEARSDATPPAVVELYTSEGCSSCPDADRWLSTLKGRPGVIALAFHVDYWDRLGWVDRYATREGTARQHELARLAGSASVYTPQVLVDGVDWRGWPQGLPAFATRRPDPIAVMLTREGQTLRAQVAPLRAAVPRLAGYWAVLEDGHQTRVQAGENDGRTLHHDHVVRLYRPLAPWSASEGLQATLEVTRGAPEFARRVVFVVTEAGSTRPLQAVSLSC